MYFSLQTLRLRRISTGRSASDRARWQLSCRVDGKIGGAKEGKIPSVPGFERNPGFNPFLATWIHGPRTVEHSIVWLMCAQEHSRRCRVDKPTEARNLEWKSISDRCPVVIRIPSRIGCRSENSSRCLHAHWFRLIAATVKPKAKRRGKIVQTLALIGWYICVFPAQLGILSTL